jgi:hypothetical protein
LRAGLRPRLVINVEGWVGNTLEERVNSAILRGARSEHATPEAFKAFRMAHFPNTPYLEIPGKAPGTISITDREMYRAFKGGALEQSIFVSGEKGATIL